MDIIGVIPARLESSRLPHKLTRIIHKKPLIQWTWERAKSAHLLDELVIACDSPEIKKISEDFGADVVLTSPEHISGTDRVAEVVRDIDVKIIINIQADEPLIHSSTIDSIATCMLNDAGISMATVIKRIDDEEEINNFNVVKVITDKDRFAVYFSRLPLPFFREKGSSSYIPWFQVRKPCRGSERIP